MLSEVLGQDGVIRLLMRLLERQRLPQVTLFEGIPGCGRRTLARALARAVLCPTPAGGDACGSCPSCRLVAAGNHPDLVELPHDSEAANVPVDLVRTQVADQAFASPLIGERRVFILHGIERFRHEAANALLKVFEEPPDRVRFIATTAQADGVLRTIRSRSQLYRLQPLGAGHIALILERHGVPAATAARRAAGCTGSHRDAWTEASDAPMAALRRLATEGLHSSTVADIMAAVEATVKRRQAAAKSDTNGLSLTNAGWQRREVRHWLLLLAHDLRQALRDPGQAAATVERLERILAGIHDLDVNIQPRLVLEAIGLGEHERYLARS